METYLVGGAVRDTLLNRPIKEKDWVVVGATETDMLKAGFRKVGKDFPVFLHPDTKEEYALARIERKVGRGYTGFAFDISKTVTLEEDLKRRDVTINAMAFDESGNLIDPYHGLEDLRNGLLRHVSDAFAEDPVHILRVARFAARFNFSVAVETLELMQQMVTNGEIDALVSERVWKELERGLAEPHPEKFFEVLESAHALPILFPELNWDSSLKQEFIKSAVYSNSPKIRLCVLLHHLTPVQLIKIADRLRLPTDYRELALLVAEKSAAYANIQTDSAIALYQFLQGLDAFRRPERFAEFLNVCQIFTNIDRQDFLKACLTIAKPVDPVIYADKKDGREIAMLIRQYRIAALDAWLKKTFNY